MAIQLFKDFVFSGNVKMILDSGVFVGTQKYLFFIPSKLQAFEGRKHTTTTFTYGDRPAIDVVADVIKASETVEELEKVLLEVSDNNENFIVHNLNDMDAFKVEANFLGSGINIKPVGKRGFSHFVQSLGKEKKEIKAFYSVHPKYS